MDYWEYPAQLERVIDGDTVDLRVDLGFKTYKKVRVRIRGIDTSEIFGISDESDEFQLGQRQKDFAEDFLSGNDGKWPLRLRTFDEETGKYGRWIGDVVVDGESYAEAVLAEWPEAEYE